MNIITRFFTGWTLFEKLWLGLTTALLVVLEIIWHDNTIGFIAAISGIICVVLVAKGKRANYYWGIINTATYAYVAYTAYQLYGEAMLNAFFYLPTQFIGLWLWTRHAKKSQDAIAGEDVYAKRLTRRQIGIGIPLLLVASVAYILFLHYIEAAQAGLDGVAVVLSVTAQILMLLRYAEQWLLWIVVDVITIALWVVTLTTTGGNDWALLVMWIAYLINAVYGYVNWRKLARATETAAPAGAAVTNEALTEGAPA